MTVISIIFALEIVFMTYFFSSFPRIRSGNFAGIFLSVIMFASTAYYKEILNSVSNFSRSALGITFITAVIMLLILIASYAAVLTILMIKAQRNYPDSVNILVVLGCRIKGTSPTRMLRRRLDTAFEYMNENPSAICIVSGGKGTDETVSEAQAMQDYLINKGIQSDRIIKEDKSVSTWENIKFSSEIAAELGFPNKITIVTDGFHQYRASLISKRMKIKTYALSAQTEPRFLFIYWLRELMALTKFFIKRN